MKYVALIFQKILFNPLFMQKHEMANKCWLQQNNDKFSAQHSLFYYINALWEEMINFVSSFSKTCLLWKRGYVRIYNYA